MKACSQEAAAAAIELIGNVPRWLKQRLTGCGRLHKLGWSCIVGAQASPKLKQLLAAILRVQADLNKTQVILQLRLGYFIQLRLQLILSLHLMRQAIAFKCCPAAHACLKLQLSNSRIRLPSF